MSGEENAYQLHDELGRTMLVDCTIERDNATLDGVLAKIDELTERAAKIGVTDTSGRANQGAQFVRHLNNILRSLDPRLLADLLAQSVQALKEEIPGLGDIVAAARQAHLRQRQREQLPRLCSRALQQRPAARQ